MMDAPNIFLWIMLSFVLGTAMGLFINWPQLTIAVFLMAAGLFIFKKEKAIFLFFVFMVLGAIRANYMLYSLKQSELLFFNDKNMEVVFSGKIDKEPEEKTLNQKLVVEIKEIIEHGLKESPQAPFFKTTGKVLVLADKKTEYMAGEKIIVKGKPESPKNFDEFDYKNYLEKQGILSVIKNPEKIEKTADAPIYFRAVFKIKEKLRKIINEGLVFPKSALLGAIVLGDKKEMPDYLKESFNKSGTRHITAISGMHIAILMNVLMAIFIGLGIKRKISGLTVMLFILFYLFLIGFPASAIRASIMGAGIILAQIFSRMPDSIRFLLFAAAAILLINPFLFFDAGFQLSFLAALGINYLSPFFNKKLKKIPKNFGIRSVLSMTFSAQIFTLPVLFYHFGYLSLLSPVANVLIVPTMPLVLAMGILGIIAGLIFLPLGFLVFIPLSFILGYVIFISDLIAAIPFFAINARVSLAVVLVYYLLLALFVHHQKRKERFWFLEY